MENKQPAKRKIKIKFRTKVKAKKPWSMTKKIVMGVAGALAVALVVLIISYVSALANPASAFKPEDFAIPVTAAPIVIDTAPAPEPTPTPEPGTTRPPPTPTPTIDPNAQLAADADMSLLQNRLNILLLGLDESRERADWGSFRTDTMILLSINFETNDVDMISVPRDSYVKIYGKEGRAKVNSAFSAGGGKDKKGFEYAMKTISGIFGDIPLNYYIGFNMQMVKDVVDAMGGVDYEVDIEVRMNGRELNPGMQHLDGQGVLDYSRQRKGSSDVARVDRQQRILMAIFKQMLDTKQFGNIPSIFQAVESNMSTNLDFRQISALALFASGIGLDNIERHLLEGDFLNMRKTSYWGVSEYKKQQLIKEIFGISYHIDSSGDVSAIKRELEEQRALISSELNLAMSLKGKCDALVSNYSSYLTPDEIAQLEAASEACQEAYDMEEKEDLDVANAYAAQVYNSIAPRLGMTDTVQPADPNVITDPNAQPVNPVNPADPNAQPVNPVGPDPVNPVDPFNPVYPADPNNPVQETPIPVLPPQEATPPPFGFAPIM